MKQALQLRQTACITPQMQQAIRLLRLSTVDLQMEIQEALDSNFMLENATDADPELDLDEVPGSEVISSALDSRTAVGEGAVDNATASREITGDEAEAIDNVPVDSDWADLYDVETSDSVANSPLRDPLDIQYRHAESLQEHLLEQVNLSVLTDTDKLIAYTVVDAINKDGYLTASVDEMWQSLNQSVELDADEVEAILHWVQSLDPPGVGARNLQECLTLQLRDCDENTPGLHLAKRIVAEHLDVLGSHNPGLIEQQLGLNRHDLELAIACIRSLNPHPGSAFEETGAEYIVPDIYVSKRNGGWHVALNPDLVPHLRVNPYYASLLKQANSRRDLATFRTQAQEARWFIKALQSRSATVLQVAAAIVERQKAFLEHGEEAMQPLVLHDIAETLAMHESTVSRATSHKYMYTPRGVYELKYFFSSHVSNTNGNEFSSTAIRAMIKKLIAKELPNAPFSDAALASTLAKQGIEVARRTVAKYRDMLGIPPANDRKRVAFSTATKP